MNILFTCAGRRNYLLHYFRCALKGRGQIFAVDASPTSPAMMAADKPILAPNLANPDYIPFLQELCARHSINAIIPLNDLELPLLARHKPGFRELGVAVLVSNESVINTCFDKWQSHMFLLAQEVNSPQTYIDLEEASEAISAGLLRFPLVLKPRWGSASICIEYPESVEELAMAYKLLCIKIRRTILYGASQHDLRHCILIQEKLTGEEYGVDIVNDLAGRYVAALCRQKLAMRAGETDKAITRRCPKIDQLSRKIGASLGHIANLDCDLFKSGDDLYVLEMNPRFGGGYPFSHVAGADLPRAILAWLDGAAAPPDCFCQKDGIYAAKYDNLVIFDRQPHLLSPHATIA